MFIVNPSDMERDIQAGSHRMSDLTGILDRVI
jgi:hypothetical protein